MWPVRRFAVGGLCGYGLEQTVDTSAGIRQLFPVVGVHFAYEFCTIAGGLSGAVGTERIFELLSERESSGWRRLRAAVA